MMKRLGSESLPNSRMPYALLLPPSLGNLILFYPLSCQSYGCPNCISKYPIVIQEYIDEELAAGWRAGPFTKDQVEQILHGPFMSPPLIVAESSQGPDQPPKLRVCRNLSKEGKDSSGKLTPSVNSYIEEELFPTTFNSANDMAEFVSLFLSFSLSTQPTGHSSIPTIVVVLYFCLANWLQLYPYHRWWYCITWPNWPSSDCIGFLTLLT